jgi:branched-chain amino acid transport system ATP-binding protein
MVAIGRMLMSDPDLLLLDEPSLCLAELAIDDVATALIALRQEGRSMLIVEQRVDLALRVCDRAYVLAGGEVALQETADALEGDGRSLVDAYLG